MKIYYLFLLSIIAISCSKDKKADEPNSVSVRIINTTSIAMENTQIAGVSYGSILPGFSTEYRQMEQFIYSAHCEFFTSGIQIYAGFWVCGTSMPAPVEAGRYTYSITEPQPGQYQLAVTKD